MSPPLRRLLVTGAAGRVAAMLRPRLGEVAREVVLSDREPLGDLAAHERSRPAPLGDASAVAAAMKDCDGVLHLGGIVVRLDAELVEPVEAVIDANIRGVVNLYEAACAAGRPRIVLASSNHVTGFHDRGTRLRPDATPRPDSLYGVSKLFAEGLAQHYWDACGQETLSVRIGSCFPAPQDRRMLATWMSPDDLLSLAARAFAVPQLGHSVVYGVSDNAAGWWDHGGEAVGWTPRDRAEDHAAALAHLPPEDPADPCVRLQGGVIAVAARRATR